MKIILSKYGTFCNKGQYYFAIPENEEDIELLENFETQVIPHRTGW